MNSKSSTSLLLATVAAIVLGGLIGYLFPQAMLSISFVGQLFLNALRIVVIPLVVATLIVGVAAMADVGRVSRTVGKTLLYFVITSAIAVVIGFGLVSLIQPGAGAAVAGATVPAEALGVTSFSVTETLGSIIPENLLNATAHGGLLGLIIFSIFIGAVLIPMGDKGKVILDFFRAVNEAVSRIIKLLLWVAPLGLLSLAGTVVAENSLTMGRMFGTFGMYSVTLIAAFLIQAVVVLPLILKFFAQKPIGEYFGNMVPAITAALGTGSAAATLPVTYDCVVDKNKVDDRAGSIALPLGTMVNMNGTALYLIVAAMFCAQMFQVNLSVIQILIVIGTSFIISFGTSLIPNATVMLLAIVMYAAGFPAEAYAGIAIVLIADWFFDRWRVAVDIWGDAVGAAVISETFDFKTARHIKSEPAGRTPLRGRKRTERPQRDSGPQRGSRSQRDQRPQRDSRQQRERDSRTQRDSRPQDSSRPQQEDKTPRQERKAPERSRDRKPREGGQDRNNRGERQSKRRERPPRTEAKPPAKQERKSNEEKASTFVMPPVPYHVLENELRPRKKEQQPTVEQTVVQKEEPKVNGSAISTPVADTALSSQTIERERAKIAAQLAELRQKEPVRTESPAMDESTPASTANETEDVAVVRDEHPDNFPKVDFYAGDDSPVQDGEESAAVKSSPVEEPVQQEEPAESPAPAVSEQATEEGKPQVFGRGKSRRTPPAKSEPRSEEPATEGEPEKSEFSKENISFGRGKRKKPSA